LVIYHQDTLYVLEQGCDNLWLFFEVKGSPREEKFGKNWSRDLKADQFAPVHCYFLAHGKID